MNKILFQVIFVTLFVFVFVVNSEPPRNSGGGGWGQQQQQFIQPAGGQGGYSGGGASGGYSGGGGGNNGGGWGQQQQSSQDGRNGGGWGSGGQQQQAQVQSGGGWGSSGQQQAQGQSGGGWAGAGAQQQSNSGGGGWGGQLNVELDTANLNLKNLNPREIFRSIIGIPRRIISFIRESGLYMLFIPLLIILPLMLLAFNAGRLIGGSGWGWGRSLSTVESGIIGYLKSPAWQKVAETLMDERVFERIMKSLEEFKDW